MSDETDTTGEVARVLDAHRLDTPTWPERRVGYCTCGIQFPNSAEFTDHQATMLAEAGLLREGGLRLTVTERHGQPAHVRIERNGVLIVNGHIEQPRVGLLHPQIATQEPAGATQGGSGDSRTLGDRLRTLRRRFIGNTGETDPNNDQDLVITGYTFWAVVQGLAAMADEAAELEAAYRVADAEIARLGEFHDHYRAQVERVRAIALEYPENDDVDYTSIARQRLAKRIREALDGPRPDTEGATDA